VCAFPTIQTGSEQVVFTEFIWHSPKQPIFTYFVCAFPTIQTGSEQVVFT
mgnify:CR=1